MALVSLVVVVVVVVVVNIVDLAPCVLSDVHTRQMWLFSSVFRQKSRESREAAPNATPSSAASAGGGSDEHVHEAEEMLHDVCQRWCTSWWKRGLFLRVRKGQREKRLGGSIFDTAGCSYGPRHVLARPMQQRMSDVVCSRQRSRFNAFGLRTTVHLDLDGATGTSSCLGCAR